MQIKVEPSGLQIGTDNAITVSIQDNQWGLRFSFQDDDFTSKVEFLLNQEQLKMYENHLVALRKILDYEVLDEELSLEDQKRQIVSVTLFCLSTTFSKFFTRLDFEKLEKQFLTAKEELSKIQSLLK